MPGPEVLSLTGVTAGYHGRPAVRRVSLSVGEGEVVGLIGPNGSGKTTLIRVASRVLRPFEGRVLVRGGELFRMSARDAARLVAVVPQETAPVFSFTVLEIVLMGRSPYLSAWGSGSADDFRRAREAMALAGVDDLAGRTIDELSGGEKQRVVLAQALAQDAPVLLLDEPTTHLDPGHVLGVLAAVRDLARAGRAVLSVFHDLNLAAASCDRLVVLDGGRVAAEGRPSDVLVPELLRDVYGVEAVVVRHPSTGVPAVLFEPAATGRRAPERSAR